MCPGLHDGSLLAARWRLVLVLLRGDVRVRQRRVGMQHLRRWTLLSPDRIVRLELLPHMRRRVLLPTPRLQLVHQVRGRHIRIALRQMPGQLFVGPEAQMVESTIVLFLAFHRNACLAGLCELDLSARWF